MRDKHVFTAREMEQIALEKVTWLDEPVLGPGPPIVGVCDDAAEDFKRSLGVRGGSSKLSTREWEDRERARIFLYHARLEYEREHPAEDEHGDADSRVGDLAGDPYTYIGDRMSSPPFVFKTEGSRG